MRLCLLAALLIAAQPSSAPPSLSWRLRYVDLLPHAFHAANDEHVARRIDVSVAGGNRARECGQDCG